LCANVRVADEHNGVAAQLRQQKGNIEKSSVEFTLQRALSLAFVGEISANREELNPDGRGQSASVEVIEFK
jgi:hypothetical protein